MKLPIFIIGFSLLALGEAIATSSFNGVWRGTFNGQPTTRNADGTYPETITAFELTLRRNGTTLTGEFRRLGGQSAARILIRNGKMFGDRGCFDLIDSAQDMRWCLTVGQNELSGIWSRGPEGGPLLDGLGIGTRLFGIKAERVHRK
jgi:hypothetical protein